MDEPGEIRSRRGRGNVTAAAVGGGTLLVLLSVLLVLVLTRPSAEPTVAGPSGTSSSSSPSPTIDVDSSVEPSSSPQVAATPTETASSGSALDNRAVAEVAVAGLNLRREPGGGAEVRGTLDEGARVFVIGDPQVVDDMAWYRVAVIAGPYSDCVETYCPSHVGWVAEGGTEADPWLRPVVLDCPSSPMTAEQLATLAPLERLSCFGEDDIVVTGTLDVCHCGVYGPLIYEPGWLALPISEFLFHGTQTFIRFEDGAPPDLVPGDVVRTTLAMEHESATACIVRGDPGFFGPMPSGESPPAIVVPDPADTVLGCRAQLVMKDYEVTGTEDVSLPGG